MKHLYSYHPEGQKLFIDFSGFNIPTKVGFEMKSIVRTSVLAVLDHEDFRRDCEVSVTFCDNEYIHSLNLEFRDKDSETDVLSFPIYEKGEAYTTDDTPVTLGDIVISLERATKQAEEIGNTLLEEVSFLTVHSMLHLLGYDHVTSPEDEAEMFGIQKEIIKNIKESNNLEDEG